MGFKSTMDLTKIEALNIIAMQVGAEFESDEKRQIERILEKVTDYWNEESKYYFYNFCVND